MVTIIDKSQCTGCGACKEICPKGCIILCEDHEGFWYPEIDNQKCEGCDLCSKICPNYRDDEELGKVSEAYIAFSLNRKIRENSSSGGIFKEVADVILGCGGVIFGCAFDDKHLAHHIEVDANDELNKLLGSKYLQSRTEDTFNKARELLEKGKIVLYSGTACQIAGLKAYLGKEYKNLYTLDILCHGVASPKLWKYYLAQLEKEYDSNSAEIRFRDKSYGWKNFSLSVLFRNNEEYLSPFSKDPYMQMFLSNICLRPSCYNCRFKGIPHLADLTIGDAWRVNLYAPDMDDDRGTSIVLLNTEKGQKLFDKIRPHINNRLVDLDMALPLNADSRKSVKIHKSRKEFFDLLDRQASISKLYSLSKEPLQKRIKKQLILFVRQVNKRITRR